MPSLTAANIHDRAAVVAALDRVLERVGRPRRIGLVVPDSVAKVSLVRFEQVPARAAGSRSAGPLAGAQERRRSRSRRRRSATCPALRAADGQRVRRRRWRGATSSTSTKRCAPRPARTPASSIWRRSTSINAVLAGSARAGRRLAAGQRRRRLRVDRDPARPAPDLLPQPRGRHRRHARRSRAPDGDVLRGSAAGRRLRARAAGRRGAAARASRRRRAGAAQPRGAAGDAGRDRRSARGGGADRSHRARRRRCSTRWRRSSACCCATAEVPA